MPELPEVETIVRTYRPKLTGRTISGFVSRWPRQVKPKPATMKSRIVGLDIVRVWRRAKYIVLTLSDDSCLTFHLKMSGRFEWSEEYDSEVPHVRAILRLAHGPELWFCDARKFGRISHAPDSEQLLSHLGPEPLSDDFSAKDLARMMEGRRGRLKPLLLDQTFLAGLGNIYVDESLFRAGLHPLSTADTLTWPAIKKLHRCIRQVLREAIRANGTSFDWIYPQGNMQNYLRVYKRTGQPCPACKTPIERLTVSTRSTHVCPSCQPAP